MESTKDLKSIYDQYVSLYPKETPRLDNFRQFISERASKRLYDRKNSVGHITASAIIIDVKDSKILLIEHKHLKKWLQPGGHVEPDDNSILDAALREVKEEVNIDAGQLRLISPSFLKYIPLDIDSHPIPENTSKNEPKHYHHDFKYLFIYTGDTSISLNKSDAVNYKWETFEKLEQQLPFRRPIKKIRHLLSSDFRPKIYFENIIAKIDEKHKKYKSIVVSHILPGSVFFHQALNKVFPIVAIIPKPNSINSEVYKLTESEFKFLHVTKEQIPESNNKLIKMLLKEEGEFIIFDIGGYFAEIEKNWPDNIKSRIKLIVEDTENGHQKYENVKFKKKVVSVARSPLKDNEDFLVGQSVLFSADVLLREQAMLIQYMKCAVFGYGKIGKSITLHLIQRGVTPMIFDTNPIRRIESFNRLASIPERKDIIQKADVIFSATGNRCLNIEDFRTLKNGCYIFSVTSSDDEFDLTFLEEEYESRIVSKHIKQYYNDNNNFYLVNEGNAVNFIHNAIMGNFIHLVRSEMILAINEIENFANGKINYVSEDLRKNISDVWLKTFDPNSKKLDFIL